MSMGAYALAVWCTVLCAVVSRTATYTVDCNHEYTDCDTELSKLANDEEEGIQTSPLVEPVTDASVPRTSTNVPPTRSTTTAKSEINETEVDATRNTVDETFTTPIEPTLKPKPRLLNLNVEELQNFANILHNNQTSSGENKKPIPDLSDINLDGDDDDETLKHFQHEHKLDKEIPEKFYSNLQAPFHPLMAMDRSEEIEITCKQNGVVYKIGEKVDRGCEETCECSPRGIFDCSEKCKHPFIRRGRRLTDPLCFESPVDECCSIIACATGNGDKTVKVEVCRFGNDTYPVGVKWNIGCEQSCICEKNSVVTCKPRCNKPPASDKCINVQDPVDACCEIQVCDVSQDVHEEPAENGTSVASTERIVPQSENTGPMESPMRPLVLTEPIGSVTVLQNNTVQVNLMHPNNSEDPIHLLLSSDAGRTYDDVELKYSNLILNLEGGRDYILKTKETGTKFNFTMTVADSANDMNEVLNDSKKIGCYEEGQFYAIGEEFRIGCTELCECTGPDTRECAKLECPSHVGLELVSKGCVRWAPNPPPVPPDCCPRTARCLSDGTCHFKGHAVPNWSEVPVSLTGCEQRCFCENGDLDCQEVCSPLPPIPPQTLRCPPMHHPAAVNISDDDCCKKWGCVSNNAEDLKVSPYWTDDYLTHNKKVETNFVTPIAPVLPIFKSEFHGPSKSSDTTDFDKHMTIVKNYPKYMKPVITRLPGIVINHASQTPNTHKNITVYTLNDVESPFKTLLPEPPLVSAKDFPPYKHDGSESMLLDTFRNSPLANENIKKIQNEIKYTKKIHDSDNFTKIFIQEPKMGLNKNTFHSSVPKPYSSITPPKFTETLISATTDKINRVSTSNFDNYNYFLPVFNIPKKPLQLNIFNEPKKEQLKSTQSYFIPSLEDRLPNYATTTIPTPLLSRKHPTERVPHISYAKPFTNSQTNNIKTAKTIDKTKMDNIWSQDVKTHVLTKAPNPYETVLHRVPNYKVTPHYDGNERVQKLQSKPYSTLDLESVLKQMEVESEVNRNLGRSAVKNRSAAGPASQPDYPFKPTPPQESSFLPTLPPETPQRFPQEEIPDYEQNNIHRPINPIESGLPALPPGLSIPPNYGEENKKLTVISLQADSPTSIKMLFGLPPVLVGLRGNVDLRYTDKTDEDVTHWYSQVFAPADEVLTTSRLEFRLTGLKPSTVYKVRGKLYLHNLPVEPESEVFTVRTQDMPTLPPIEEKRREIDSKLTVVDVNDTTARVTWRYFTEDELQFIDGIQVRYRPVGTPIYSMTELLHHSRSTAELHELRPGSSYEASLVLIPPPRAMTELYDPGRVEFTTSPYVDPYNWSVVIEARAIGAHAAEVRWRGPPAPPERWVRVYRAAHACSGKSEQDAFRLAARDMPPTITLSGLEPDTRCRIWLELFLTNGKIKTSNVLEINTKPENSNEPIDNEIASASIGSGGRGSPRGDYYGALVAVGVVAALGALTSLLLLLIVVRRHRPRSVPITQVPSAPRESSLPPYDNPAYKLELQQETMDL